MERLSTTEWLASLTKDLSEMDVELRAMLFKLGQIVGLLDHIIVEHDEIFASEDLGEDYEA